MEQRREGAGRGAAGTDIEELVREDRLLPVLMKKRPGAAVGRAGALSAFF